MTVKTLESYMTQVCQAESQYNDLDKVVLAIASGAIITQKNISHAQLSLPVETADHDYQKTVEFLDTAASDTFVNTMTQCGHVGAIGCKSIKQLVDVGSDANQRFIVQMDPLNGVSNIDVAINIGSIFGIWPDNGNQTITLRSGNEQVAALYILYSSNTMLVIATGGRVNGFTLNPANDTFELTHPNIKLQPHCCCYSINEGNFYRFDAATQNAVVQLRRNHRLRYIGSLAADFHRNLLRGGIFLYPGDSCRPEGKIRLMYEANPLSFIVEHAGGLASSGSCRILDIQPDHLHQTTPLIMGHKGTVDTTLKTLQQPV